MTSKRFTRRACHFFAGIPPGSSFMALARLTSILRYMHGCVGLLDKAFHSLSNSRNFCYLIVPQFLGLDWVGETRCFRNAANKSRQVTAGIRIARLRKRAGHLS